MGELRFTYGVMGAHKTAEALMQRYSLDAEGFRVLLMKPSIDNRAGKYTVKSRAGLEAEAVIFSPDQAVTPILEMEQPQMVIIDEAQFATPEQIDEFKDYSIRKDVNVYAYGLKTDFRTKLFPGAQRLIELADQLNELEVMCGCGKHKATVSARFGSDGKIVTDGSVVQIGGDEQYKGMCYSCFSKAKEKGIAQRPVTEESKPDRKFQPLIKNEPIFKETPKAVAILVKSQPEKVSLQWIPKSQAAIRSGYVTAVSDLAAKDSEYLKASIREAKMQKNKNTNIQISKPKEEVADLGMD